jgi:hypothetical protein
MEVLAVMDFRLNDVLLTMLKPYKNDPVEIILESIVVYGI